MAGIADKKYTFKVATDATKVGSLRRSGDPVPSAKVARSTPFLCVAASAAGHAHQAAAASKKAIVTLTKDSRKSSSQQHGLIRPTEEFLYGDMTPITIIHKINKGE